MKKSCLFLIILMVFSIIGSIGALGVGVSDPQGAQQALAGLSGTTLATFDDYFAKVTKTNNDQITMEKIIDGEGMFAKYVRANVLSVGSGSTSRQLMFSNRLSGIATGDVVLFKLVMRSAGTGNGKASLTLYGPNASGSARKDNFVIPTQWTEFYWPLTAIDNATTSTFRLHSLVQTIDIADFQVINYGNQVDIQQLPRGSYPVPEKEENELNGLTGGTLVTLSQEQYPQAMAGQAGDSITFSTTPVTAGNMALLSLDVRAASACSNVTVSFGGITKQYAIPVQWSRIYMPVQAETDLSGAQITVDSGKVLVAAAKLENKGSATFEDLTLQSGMWLLEEFQDIALNPVGVGAGKTTDLVISPDGKYAYSIGGGNFTVTDISDPQNPQIIKQLTGFGDTRQIALCAEGNAVIFTCRLYGAYIIDVSDPANAYVRSHYDTLEMGTGIATYKNYAFICSRFYGVEVVDLSDLDNPTHKCIIRNGGEVQSVEVVDGYLYGGLYNTNQVEIYDVRDPVNYTRVGVADLKGRGDGVTVAKVGEKTYLYAGTGHHSVAGLATTTPLSNLNYGDGNGLDIFDVTDPANPVWLSTSRTDGRFYHTKCDYWGAQISHDEETGKYYAYLVSTYNGIYVFDVTDPAAPIRVAHVAVRITPDSELYTMPTSSRAIAFQYDPAQYIQGPAGAVACADGVLLYAGAETDLHVLAADFAHAHVQKPETAEISSQFDYYHWDSFSDLTNVKTADPKTQTASVALYGDKVYVSGGDKGILIYSQDLQTLYKTVALSGCSYDVYIQDGKLYSSEGTEGLAIYTLSTDGLTLTEITRYKSGCVTMARPSVTGKFVSIHCGATVGRIIDVSGSTPVSKVRAVASSQMYHHNVTGIVAGRYVGFWANSGSERWYDLGENDSLSTPVLLSNVPSAGFSPTKASMTGSFVPYGSNQVLCTGNGGYYVYDPSAVNESQYKAMGVIRPKDADGNTVQVTGKPALHGDILILSDRIYGKLYVLDISNLNAPVLLRAFENLPGNPDAATFSGNFAYVPMGYQGILRLDLQNFVDMTQHFGGDHCVCGGHSGMTEHSCTTVTWKPWSSSNSLPTSGNYYLTCDVTVAAQTKLTGRVNLCLHGHSVTATAADRIYYSENRELHITDCHDQASWGSMVGSDVSVKYPNDGGAIFYGKSASFRLYLYAGNFVGGTAARGGVAYASGGQVHVCGGNLQDGIATKMGGNLYANVNTTISIHSGTVKDGTANSGGAGNIYMNVGTMLYVYGGEVSGGSAKTDGGNLCLNAGGSKANQPGAVCLISGGSILNGSADRNGNNIYGGGKSSLNKGSELTISGGSVSGGDVFSCNLVTLGAGEAASQITMANDAQLHLTSDAAASVKVTGNLHLLLNGHTLAGNVIGTGTLYGMDSSSDTYTLPTGRIEGTVSCQMPVHFKTDITGQPMRYMAIADETGYTFHRFYLGLTHISLRPVDTGVGYKAVFRGSDAVKAQLSAQDAFGYSLWLDGQTVSVTAAKDQQAFSSGTPVTLRLHSFDVARFGETAVNAKVFMQLADGTMIESSAYSYTLRDLLETVASDLDRWNSAQMTALKELVARNIEVMQSWALGGLLEAA